MSERPESRVARALERLILEHESTPQISWHEDRPTPRSIASFRSKRFAGTPEEAARAFLSRNRDLFLMREDLSDLEVKMVQESLSGYHVRFQQRYHAIPVYGAEVSVHMDKLGRIHAVHNNYYPDLSKGAIPIKPRIAQDQAIAAASEALQLKELRGQIRHELVVYPGGDKASLAWQVLIPAKEPLGDWEYIVDALSGQILSSRNLLKFASGRGRVFSPNPVVTLRDNTLRDNNDRADAVPISAYFDVVLLDLDGSGFLNGPYVNTSPTANRANEPKLEFNYLRDDRRFEEVMAYFHIDSMQRYIQSLGFRNVVNHSIPVNAHATPKDQSFFSVADGSLNYGDGGVDDAEDAEIIAHEYGHAIQNSQVPGFGSSPEAGAIGEGFGDYWAASFYARVSGGFQDECVGDWDATSISQDIPPCLRRVDSKKQYPADLIGDVHDDGQIWSACLWEIRSFLGGTAADRLIIESHFALSPSARFIDAANAILAADRNLNGGANVDPIRRIFERRGIIRNPEYSERLVEKQFVGSGVGIGLKADDATVKYDLPFRFPFFGTFYNSVFISTNGFLDFRDQRSDFDSDVAKLSRRVMIAPLWDDLRTNGSAQPDEDVYVAQPGDGTFVVRWRAETFDGVHPVNVEAVLYRDGRIQFNYGSGNQSLSPIVGISNGDGINMILASYNKRSFLADVSSLLFTPDRVPGPGRFRLIFPILISGQNATFADNFVTGFAIVNPSNGPANVFFSAYDVEGRVISGPGIANPVRRLLGPGKQNAVLDWQLFGFSGGQLGWVEASSDVEVKGFFLLFDSEFRRLADGIDVSPLTSKVLIFPYAEFDAKTRSATRYAICNPNAEPATVTLTFFKTDGTAVPILTFAPIVVPPKGLMLASSPQELARGGHLRVESTQPISGVAIWGNNEQIAAIKAFGAEGGAAEIFLPHFVSGGGFATDVVITNPTDQAVDLRLTAFREDGAAIGSARRRLAARQQLLESVGSMFSLGGFEVGYLKVESSAAGILGFAKLEFRSSPDASPQASAAVALLEKPSSSLLFAHVANNVMTGSGRPYLTGVALLNPSRTESARFTLSVFDSFGKLVATGQFSLGPRQRVAKLLSAATAGEGFFTQPITQAGGHVLVNSDVALFGLELFFTDNVDKISAVPAQ